MEWWDRLLNWLDGELDPKLQAEMCNAHAWGTFMQGNPCRKCGLKKLT
jgi:hypothetical protein